MMRRAWRWGKKNIVCARVRVCVCVFATSCAVEVAAALIPFLDFLADDTPPPFLSSCNLYQTPTTTDADQTTS